MNISSLSLKRRIKRIQSILNVHPENSALFVSSSVQVSKSRDQQHPFHQNSDFLFLTGSNSEQCALLIQSHKKPLLVAVKRDAHKILWEGPQETTPQIAKRIGAELVLTDDIDGELYQRLKGIETLYYSTEQHTVSFRLASRIFSQASHLRYGFPRKFIHSDAILEPLRLYKDKEEVQAIKKANACTTTAMLSALHFLVAGKSEHQIMATIDYCFQLQGAENAFASIIAAGKNGATLHHKSSLKKLKNGELLLLDVGARLNGYCGDISRTIAVGGRFDPIDKELVEVVCSAQKAALKKVRHNVLVKDVYEAAAKELSIGMRELKVLKAPLATIMKKALYKPFFPHGIGHTLGLDVHDIGNIRANNEARLEAGMVITIEPGLYFSKPIGKVKACGVRVEDNVLVTPSGCEILSEGFPKKPSDIEKLFS